MSRGQRSADFDTCQAAEWSRGHERLVGEDADALALDSLSLIRAAGFSRLRINLSGSSPGAYLDLTIDLEGKPDDR